MVYLSEATLDQTFSAVSHPTRRAILARLAQGEASITELAQPFGMSFPAISKHLRVLEQAGLLHQRKLGRTHYCRLEAKPMRDAAAWLAFYQRFWDAQLQSLDDYLSQEKLEATFDPPSRKSHAGTQRKTRPARHA
jgi:DNA-binding transcriptional ArsR family regulator